MKFLIIAVGLCIMNCQFIMLTVKNTKILNVLDRFATPQICGICSLDLKKKF